MTDLLGCPFCGALPKMVEENLNGPIYWSIACDNDDCASRPTLVHTDNTEAIAAWNRRAPPSPQVTRDGEREALAEKHAKYVKALGEGVSWAQCCAIAETVLSAYETALTAADERIAALEKERTEANNKFIMHTAEVHAWLAALADEFGASTATNVKDACSIILDTAKVLKDQVHLLTGKLAEKGRFEWNDAELQRQIAKADALEASLAERDQRITELQKLVYVPGVLKCAKCKCVLITTNLHVDVGAFSANNDSQQCPNGCGPMWRRTEREAGNELVDRLEEANAKVAERDATIAAERSVSDQKIADLQEQRDAATALLETAVRAGIEAAFKAIQIKPCNNDITAAMHAIEALDPASILAQITNKK